MDDGHRAQRLHPQLFGGGDPGHDSDQRATQGPLEARVQREKQNAYAARLQDASSTSTGSRAMDLMADREGAVAVHKDSFAPPVVDPSAVLNMHLPNVGGLEAQIDILRREISVPRAFDRSVTDGLGHSFTRAFLLEGPPGTGKTNLVRALASTMEAEVRVLSAPELLSKYVGQSAANIRTLFDEAYKAWEEHGSNSPLFMYIIDEFDGLCGVRTAGGGDASLTNTSIVAQLNAVLDGVETPNNFLVFGLTNRPENLDPSLLRPGRFGRSLHFDLPSDLGRLQILKIHTLAARENGFLDPDVDLPQLSRQTINFTGAELWSLCQAANHYAMERCVVEMVEHSQHNTEAQDLRLMQEMAYKIYEIRHSNMQAFAGDLVQEGEDWLHSEQARRAIQERLNNIRRRAADRLRNQPAELPRALHFTAGKDDRDQIVGLPYARLPNHLQDRAPAQLTQEMIDILCTEDQTQLFKHKTPAQLTEHQTLLDKTRNLHQVLMHWDKNPFNIARVLPGKTRHVSQEIHILAHRRKELAKEYDFFRITQQDFDKALRDARPKFGRALHERSSSLELFDTGAWQRKQVLERLEDLWRKVSHSDPPARSSVLVEGPGGCGKTALIELFAFNSDASFLRVVNAAQLAHLHERVIAEQVHEAVKEAEDAKSSAIVVFDDLDTLVGFQPGGEILNPVVLRTFRAATCRSPRQTHGIMVVATVRDPQLRAQLTRQGFFHVVEVPDVFKLPSPDKEEALRQVACARRMDPAWVDRWETQEQPFKTLQHFLEFLGQHQ